jgi:WD40 repeat protein
MGKQILTADFVGFARLWDAASRSQIGAPLELLTTLNSAVFSPDGKKILTADFTGSLRSGLPLHERKSALSFEPNSEVYSAVFQS